MEKIPIKKILNGLSKLEKYDYPVGEHSLFILPNGNMVGVEGISQHQTILERILKRKLTSTREQIDIIIATGCIRIIISKISRLYVDIPIPVTTEQKYTLEGLGLSTQYTAIEVDNLCDQSSNAPSVNYCRRLLKLPFE